MVNFFTHTRDQQRPAAEVSTAARGPTAAQPLGDTRSFDLQARSVPAWLLSICVHLGLLILLGLVIQSPRAQGLSQQDREVGITLAQVGENTTEYFDQTDTEYSPRGVQASDATADTAPAAFPTESALTELTSPDLTLPGPAAAVPATGLVPEMDYSPVTRGGQPSATDIHAARAEDTLMRQRQGTPGPKTDISLFGSAAAVGNSFVFVLDRSDSMGRGGLGVIALAKREFQRALAKLEPVHQFQIVAYNHQQVFFGGRRKLVPATEPNKELVGKFMSGLASFGATNHFSAIMTALNRSPDVVFLLTDGGDPPLSHPQMVQILKRARERTTIHCIEFGRGPFDGEENFMQRLARDTHGSFRYVNVSAP